MLRRLVLTLSLIALGLLPVLVGVPAVHAAGVPSDNNGTYLWVSSTRLLDTRSAGGKVAAGSTRTIQVTGKAGIPTTGVGAAVVNLTVTGTTSGGYLSAYPGGATPSGTSALNFTAGETRANLVTVPVGSNGTITVLNGGGAGTAPAHVIADVQGYYLDSRATPARTPALYRGSYDDRLGDTRTDGNGPLPAQYYIRYGYYQDASAPIVAYALNVTATRATSPGYLVAWNGATNSFPSTSVLNFAPGSTTPNNVVVPATTTRPSGETRDVAVFAIGNGAGSGSVQVIVDVVGVYVQSDLGEVFRPLAQPERIVDSRAGKGVSTLGANQPQRFTAPDSVLGPNPDATLDLVGNLTAVRPTATTYLTLYPDLDVDTVRPDVSNLNPAAGQTVANHTWARLGDGNRVYVANAAGATDVLLDVTGYFVATSADSGRARSEPAPRHTDALAPLAPRRGTPSRQSLGPPNEG